MGHDSLFVNTKYFDLSVKFVMMLLPTNVHRTAKINIVLKCITN